MSDTGILLSQAEIDAITGPMRRARDQLAALQAMGIKCWLTPRSPLSVILPRPAYEGWLRQREEKRRAEEERQLLAEYTTPPRPVVEWEDTPLGKWQAKWRAMAAERQERSERAAEVMRREREATRPMREIQAELRRAALVRFHANKRRVTKLQRTPAWADDAAIRAIYLEAQELTRNTGVRHHVDHIIPLQGELVSGMHVENNLQILTGSENSRKRNKYEVEA